jgi:hypothetical protein
MDFRMTFTGCVLCLLVVGAFMAAGITYITDGWTPLTTRAMTVGGILSALAYIVGVTPVGDHLP